jgi:VIT1/CCC1 family predicted Fe2+/Mn2+ transporter
MSDFSTKDREKLINAAKRIHEHKVDTIFGFKTLANSVEDVNLKKILTQVYSEEEIIAKDWANRIIELGGTIDRNVTFVETKQKILLRVLGTKGFFEWILEEEEAGIKDVALQAELIKNNVQSELWSRYASDELRHILRIKNQVLGMDSWTFHGTSGPRSVSTIYSNLYGGLISMLVFLNALIGARLNLSSILVSGIATLFAGSISSAGGSYQALLAEMEVITRESKEQGLNRKTTNDEYEQLRQFYYSEGYSEEESNDFIKAIKEKRLSNIEIAIDHLGLSPITLGNPIENAITSGVAFAIASAIPLLPFIISPFELGSTLFLSLFLTLFSLFCIGGAKAIFSRKTWIRSGLEVMIFGAIASLISYIIGGVVQILSI